MLRVHRRAEYLDQVFKTLDGLKSKDRTVHVCVLYDRASADVVRGVAYCIEKYSDLRVHELQSPFPLVDEEGEHFMEGLQVQYEWFREQVPELDVCSLWDDDMWFDRQGLSEAKQILNHFSWDRVETRSYFLWDTEDQANENFPPHWQALFFRVYETDHYTTDFMVHCPEHVAFSPYFLRMRARLLNAGYLDQEGRQRTWEMYRKAGKVDAHTMVLVTPPRLVDVSGMAVSS